VLKLYSDREQNLCHSLSYSKIQFQNKESENIHLFRVINEIFFIQEYRLPLIFGI
jgi:hypothetical protein